MPPIPTWFAGRWAVGRFLGQRMSGPPKTWLTVHTAANTQPAVGLYLRREDGTWHAESLHVLTVTSRGIARIVAFRGPATFTAFQLPTVQVRAGTIGSRLINLPARVDYSACNYTLHLPVNSRHQTQVAGHVRHRPGPTPSCLTRPSQRPTQARPAPPRTPRHIGRAMHRGPRTADYQQDQNRETKINNSHPRWIHVETRPAGGGSE